MGPRLNLYMDASALVKRYVDEDGSEVVEHAMREAEELIACRIVFVETMLALQAKAQSASLRAARNDWSWFGVLDVDQPLCDRAAELGIKHGLRTLDALHLATSLAISYGDLTFATWDHRLHAAAAAEGLQTLPESLS